MDKSQDLRFFRPPYVDITVYTPACLAKTTDGATFNGKSGTLVGWGQDAEFPYTHVPEVPMEVKLTVATRTDAKCAAEHSLCKWAIMTLCSI